MWPRKVSWLAARAVELVLAVGGLGFAIFGDETEKNVATFLFYWVSLALLYLVIGGIAARRRRLEAGRGIVTTGRRFSFLLTVAASVTGLTAALNVLGNSGETDYSEVIEILGVMAVICAWLLLHAGYAGFYATWRDDLHFPKTDEPGIVEYLYFAVTIGVSFAASDVSVLSRPLRWHVMVHSVISFFYNAVVLAIAVGVITRK